MLVDRVYDKSKNRYDFSMRGVLRVDALEPQQPKRWSSIYMKTFINKKLFYTFYYNMTYYDLRKHAVKAKRRKTFVFNYFLLYLETRLDTILFRSHFFHSVYMIRQFILHGHATVNNKRVTNYSHRVKFFDIVSVKKNKRAVVFNVLKAKIDSFMNKKLILFEYTVPMYLEVSYRLLCVMFLPRPMLSLRNVYYPKQLNVEQLMHVYKKSQR
jgi:ribosomal protein S4